MDETGQRRFIHRDGKKLRCGYTTGSCAAAAAKAAVIALLSGNPVSSVSIRTPGGISLTLDVSECAVSEDAVRCAVIKDSGDDPDVTNGIYVNVTARKTPEGLQIEGGEGVGRVTKPGLDQPVGAAAINSVPRAMLAEAGREVCARFGYPGGLSLTVSIPGGKELAQRTFNPRMGIVDGLSVIGTTGIVEPMSSAALLDTIRLELRMLYASGSRAVLLVPGNYGKAFAETVLSLDVSRYISCGNFIGDAIDAAVLLGFEKILLLGHVGKLVKLGIGMLNTHSAYGDGRLETLAACAAESGAASSLLKAVLSCVSTDAALFVLRKSGLLSDTLRNLGLRIDACLKRRVPAPTQIGYVCYTNAEPLKGVLVQSANAETLLDRWRTER
jgi:cobalt-precorrin-5B (C1)-methyltransferase